MDYNKIKKNEVLYTKEDIVILRKPVKIVLEKGTPILPKKIDKQKGEFTFNVFGENIVLDLNVDQINEYVSDFIEKND